MTEEMKLKNEINEYFQAVYELSMGQKQGHYEAMFKALHKTIEVFCIKPFDDGIPVKSKIKKYVMDEVVWNFVHYGIYLVAAIKVADWARNLFGW